MSAFVPSHLPDLHDVVRGTAAHAVTTVEAFGGIWQQLSGLGGARASSYFAALTLHRGISQFKTKAAVTQRLHFPCSYHPLPHPVAFTPHPPPTQPPSSLLAVHMQLGACATALPLVFWKKKVSQLLCAPHNTHTKPQATNHKSQAASQP